MDTAHLRKLVEAQKQLISNLEAQVDVLSTMLTIPKSCLIDPNDPRLRDTFDTGNPLLGKEGSDG